MTDISDLYSSLQAHCSAIDQTKYTLAAQLSGATDSERTQIQSEILSLSVKQGQIQGAFLKQAMDDETITDAISAIGAQTNAITSETANITSAAAALETASKVIGYITQVIGVLAPLLA